MDRLWEDLRRAGADADGASRRFAGDGQLYLTCLRIFLTDERFSSLGQSLQMQDVRGAFETAHALRGAAGNLGLTPIWDALSRLVEPLRTGTAPIQELEPVFQQALSERERFFQIFQPLL